MAGEQAQSRLFLFLREIHILFLDYPPRYLLEYYSHGLHRGQTMVSVSESVSVDSATPLRTQLTYRPSTGDGED
jgi:hypothetical protein